jgi:hypothetical protein
MFHNDAKHYFLIKLLIIRCFCLCQTFRLVEFLHTLGGMTTRFAVIFSEVYKANRSLIVLVPLDVTI